MDVENIQRIILQRMFKDKIIGGRHTATENLKKGFAKHLRGQVEKEIRNLIKAGFILSKPTGYGLQVSLNPYMIAEIKRIIRVDNS